MYPLFTAATAACYNVHCVPGRQSRRGVRANDQWGQGGRRSSVQPFNWPHFSSPSSAGCVNMFAGCAYRRRTGACTCDNPPIGCVRDAPAPAPFRLSFPEGVKSYRDLRTGASPAPSSVAQQRVTAAPPVVREVAPRAPCVLPRTLPLAGGASVLPALGWRCTAEDASAALAAGVPLLLCGGCAETERALGDALHARSDGCVQSLVCTTVADACELPGCEQRLHRAADVVLLRVGVTDCDLTVAWGALCEAVPGAIRGLQMADVRGAQALLQTLLQGSPPALPSLLALPLFPSAHRQHRALAGLCRRAGVLLMALDPCGGDGALQLGAEPAVLAAAAGRMPDDPHAACVDALLAWCVGRQVLAAPCAAEGAALKHVALLSSHPAMDLQPHTRAMLDALASE